MRIIVRQLAYLLAVLALVATFAPAYAQQRTAEVEKAVGFIRNQQQPDGSFAGFGPGTTADAIFALSAANINIAEINKGGKTPVDFMRAQAKGVGKDTGVAAKFLIAMLLAGQSPTAEGVDLVTEVQNGYNAQTGQYGKDVTSHAYALIGLVAAGQTPRTEAIDALKKLQLSDGGWSFDGNAATGSDTNTTALAVQALKAVGDTSDAISKAVAYYRTQQNADGGFPYSQTSQYGNASDANSTALSIQALIAAGENPANWAKDGKTPPQRLLAFQNTSGAFRFQDSQPEDNALATYQAIPAVVGKTLPLEGIAIALPDQSAATVTPSPAGTVTPSPAGTTTPNPAGTVTPSPAGTTTPEQPAGTTVPGPGSTEQPLPSGVPLPTTPAGVSPVRLPDTGVADLIPVLALLAALLLLGGVFVNRRRA